MTTQTIRKRIFVRTAFFALLFFLPISIISYHLIENYHLSNLNRYSSQAHSKATLISTITHNALQKGQFDSIQALFDQWSKEDNSIEKIRLTAKNGFIIADIGATPDNQHSISFNLPIEYSYDQNAELFISINRDDLFASRKQLLFEAIAILLVITLVFAVLISQSMVIRQNQRLLEETVEERTKELAMSKEIAEKANHDKSLFLANMSHELRTPMHAILSFASLAMKKTDSEKITHYLDNIRTSGLRLTSLLNNLLDLSKLEAGKMETSFTKEDLVILVQDAIDQVSSLVSDKNITVNFNADKSLDCMLDHTLITQVVINVLSNAIKFSPHNSMINLDIKLLHRDQAEFARLTVTDQGVGIPPDEIEVIFDRFVQSSTTRSNAGGTGLGLPITKEIMDLHHGKIWAVSPPENSARGTTIIIELPVLQELAEKP